MADAAALVAVSAIEAGCRDDWEGLTAILNGSTVVEITEAFIMLIAYYQVLAEDYARETGGDLGALVADLRAAVEAP